MRYDKIIFLFIMQKKQIKQNPKNLQNGFQFVVNLFEDIDAHQQIANEENTLHRIELIRTDKLIKLISSTSPHERSQKQFKLIAELLKYQKYFKVLAKDPKILNDIASFIDYKKVYENEYIYKAGDLADCFYVLLKGQVHLTLTQKEQQPADQQEEQQSLVFENLASLTNYSSFYPTNISFEQIPKLTKKNQSSPVHKNNSLFSEAKTMIEIKQETPKIQSKWEQRTVSFISQGGCFGQITMGEHSRRGTNAKAAQTCHLIIIRKNNYDTISRAQLKTDAKTKLDFLTGITLFQYIYRHSLQSFLYNLEEVSFTYSNVLYRQGDLIKYVYIIEQGQFKMFKNIKKCKRLEGHKQDQFFSSDKSVVRQQSANRKLTIPFKTVETGQILADSEVYFKQKFYDQTCVCCSQIGKIFRIQKNKFLKRILASDNKIDLIEQYFSQKSKRRMFQIDKIQSLHTRNQICVKYLQSPNVPSRNKRIQSAVQRAKTQKQQQLRKISLQQDNFFNLFNKTVRQSSNSNRISLPKPEKKQTIESSFRSTTSETNQPFQKRSSPQIIPHSIRDIVEIVDFKINYQKIRKPKQNQTLYEMNLNNVPLYIKKKYNHIFKLGK